MPPRYNSLIKRRLLTLASSLSLLLLLPSATLCLYGQFLSNGDTFGPQTERLTLRCTWRSGMCHVWYGPSYVTQWSVTAPPLATLGRARLSEGQANGTATIHLVSMPQAYAWTIAGVSAILPALYAWRRLRDRPRPPHACPHCGYDLRATPDRCPECGATPVPSSQGNVIPHAGS